MTNVVSYYPVAPQNLCNSKSAKIAYRFGQDQHEDNKMNTA